MHSFFGPETGSGPQFPNAFSPLSGSLPAYLEGLKLKIYCARGKSLSVGGNRLRESQRAAVASSGPGAPRG